MIPANSHHLIENSSASHVEASGERSVTPARRSTEFTFMEAGFTLMELVIVMSIMVILAAVGVANYQKIREKAKETLLKDDLKTMRKLIDQYSADKEALPDSLDDLVSGTYMREVPIDPITGNADWQLEMGDDPNARTTKQGVVDVHSKAPGADAEGKPFADY
jgi:general secretion pathway protein G